MAFIREKTVKDKQYAYLVENTWKDGKTRQKVSAYLGKIVACPQTPEPQISQSTAPQHIIKVLIQQELRTLKEVTWSKTQVTQGKKPVVVKLNGGYLCNHTLKEIQRALDATQEERPGTALAQAFSKAGLRIPQHAFIALYTHHQ